MQILKTIAKCSTFKNICSSNMAYPNLHFAGPLEKRGLTNVISGINYMNVKYIDALCLEG